MGIIQDKCCPRQKVQDDHKLTTQLETETEMSVESEIRVPQMLESVQKGEEQDTGETETPLHIFIPQSYIENLEKQFFQKIGEKLQKKLDLKFEETFGHLEKASYYSKNDSNKLESYSVQKWKFQPEVMTHFLLNNKRMYRKDCEYYEVIKKEFSKSDKIQRQIVLGKFKSSQYRYMANIIITKSIKKHEFIQLQQCVTFTDAQCYQDVQNFFQNIDKKNLINTVIKGVWISKKKYGCKWVDYSLVDYKDEKITEEILDWEVQMKMQELRAVDDVVEDLTKMIKKQIIIYNVLKNK